MKIQLTKTADADPTQSNETLIDRLFSPLFMDVLIDDIQTKIDTETKQEIISIEYSRCSSSTCTKLGESIKERISSQAGLCLLTMELPPAICFRPGIKHLASDDETHTYQVDLACAQHFARHQTLCTGYSRMTIYHAKFKYQKNAAGDWEYTNSANISVRPDTPAVLNAYNHLTRALATTNEELCQQILSGACKTVTMKINKKGEANIDVAMREKAMAPLPTP